ncbi:MAG: EamA/RhaT family transporter, partial [Aggregatilineales bacterium]
MPTPVDMLIMCGLGMVWAAGMYLIARGYSLALASVAAPFEYVTLPINTMWGFLLWQEIPTIATLIGAGLTIASGLYILYQERRQQKEKPKIKPQRPVS